MNEIAIRVSNLSKQYNIGHRDKNQTLREALVSTLRSPKMLRKSNAIPEVDTFWALHDISFEVKQGEAVGIIGRNGAGKSTLLKIISRITKPTRGRVDIFGRVGSLLEVGTGFHTELTGRENIYLNGAVLGMKRREIDRRFDEIVEFSEIERFLDTPVKHYSSGMYMRLAFAVAAHLEPEILIVDEVLAVGDVEFQKKCLGKMGDVTKEGRTVLFVSHNLDAVERLCRSCLLLEKGQIKLYSDSVSTVTHEYLRPKASERDLNVWENQSEEYSNPYVMPNSISLVYPDGEPAPETVNNTDDVIVLIDVTIRSRDTTILIGYSLYDENNNLIYHTYQTDQDETRWPKLEPGRWVLKSPLPRRFLNEGSYRLELTGELHQRQWLFQPGRNNPFIIFSVQGRMSDSPYWVKTRPGMLAPVLTWQAEKIDATDSKK